MKLKGRPGTPSTALTKVTINTDAFWIRYAKKSTNVKIYFEVYGDCFIQLVLHHLYA